jgi:L-phenylalanine/L-methionine N-acetyltransferase
MWVGEYGKRIVARAVAERMDRRERENISLSLYISKEFRGAGLGTVLLRMLIEEAQRLFKPHNLYLTVYSNNLNAIRMYEKEGFTKAGVLPGWMKHQNEYLDRIYMVYRPSEHKLGKGEDGEG